MVWERQSIPTTTTMAPTLRLNDGVGEAMHLFARDDNKDDNKPHKDPSKGVLDPHDISNVGFFVLFALIGVGFVAALIWFFFWAKNGGFYFKENDWEDYKTAVLRRRGPNGTIYSDVTPSTDLGGGSVYKDVEDDKRTTVTDSTGLSGITAGASDIGAREKREEKRRQKKKQREERDKEKGGGRRHVGDDGVTDEFAEKKAKDELRSYRHEKSARVGGLNKESDGSTWDGSTNPTSSTADSELLPNKQSTPENTPKKKGIRKVYSTADRNAAREDERIRAEARRLRDQGRNHRRDFSFQRAAPTDSLLSGSTAESSSDVGTKSYHHSRPELREQRQKEREERRARRGGYRRGRGDDDDDL